MAKHACFRSDNMAGTKLGYELVAIKYRPDGTDTAIENGNIVAVGNFINGEADVRVATTPTADTPLTNLAVVGAPEVDKTKAYNTVDDFINKAGVPARAYRLVPHAQYSVTAEALTAAAEIAVGDVVEAQAGTKANVVKTATEGATTIGHVMAIEGDFIVIEVA